MKQTTIIIALLLIAANLFSQETKKVETPSKSISYMIDMVSADTGFYLIEQIKEYAPGTTLPKVTNNPYYYRDTLAFIAKINDLKKSAEFKLAEANKKLDEARQLNLESELRVRQAEILAGLLEAMRAPAATEVKPKPAEPVVNKSQKPKKTKKE